MTMADFMSILSNLPRYGWPTLYALWVVLGGAYLLLQRRSPSATLAWLLAFAFLPVIAGLAYLFLGPRRLRRRQLRRSVARKLVRGVTGRELAGLDDAVLADFAHLRGLALLGSRRGLSPPQRARAVTMLNGGDETYASIDAALRAAKRQIHLEYYIWQPDQIGTRWRDLLAQRAAEGVEIRVLVDAMGSSKCNAAFWEPIRKAGGEVALFNPVKLLRFRPTMLNFRTHRKIVVVDGDLAFTGGINVAAEHSSGLSSGGMGWRDTHMKVEGAPALDLQRVFLEDWVYAHGGQMPPKLDGWFPKPISGAGPWVQIIDTGPEGESPDILRFIIAAISQARVRAWITTPYFVPDDALYTAIVSAKARGVDVRLIVPIRGDSRLVTAASATFHQDLALEGVTVYRYTPVMIHAKTAVIDEDLSIVGTANLDNRSFKLNFEVIAAVYGREANATLAQWFLDDQSKSERLEVRKLRETRHERLMAGVARLFAPVL